MMQWDEGVYEDPDENASGQCELAAGAATCEVEQSRRRLVVLRNFEPNAALSAEERAAYCRRFCTLFADERSERKGGVGTVLRVQNAFGEKFALKVLNPAGGASEQSRAQQVFAEEYRCHQAVQGTKGFPKLYGKGTVDGQPAMVMEWVAGVSLREAIPQLAVNGEGALSPLMAARIGRDLFALVERMAFVGEGVVHRDISPSNIMIRTSRVSLQEQIDDGRFDLFLIDFGSAFAVREADPTFTAATGVLRKATANYAPPEMLTNDVAGVAELRQSSQVDVYAAASVLYELATGKLPFNLSQVGEGQSFYRIKSEQEPAIPRLAHRSKRRGCESLSHDAELSVMLEGLCHSEQVTLEDEELWDAVAFVDQQLVELLMPCLSPVQAQRPTAQEMSGALSSFARNYERNLYSSYVGEPLIPCVLDGMPEGNAEYLIALRDTVKAAIKAASFALFVVAVVATGVLTAGVEASTQFMGANWQGALSGFDVSCALALPAFVGFVLRGRKRDSVPGFIRATASLLVVALLVGVGFGSLQLPASAINDGLIAALFASSVSAWCTLVMDYAFAVVIPLARRIKRRGLPAAKRNQRQGLPQSHKNELPQSSQTGQANNREGGC